MFRWYRARNEGEKVGVPEQAFLLVVFCCWTVVERGGEERRREEKAQEFSIVGRHFSRITIQVHVAVWNR